MDVDEDWDHEEERAKAEARDKQSAEEEENRAEEERSVARAEDQWKLSHLANTRFADLEGDDYFVKAYTGSPIFQPFEAAVAEVQGVEFLCRILRSRGLEYILADKYATAGLKKALLAHNVDVIRAVKNCRTPRDKGGRPAKLKK